MSTRTAGVGALQEPVEARLRAASLGANAGRADGERGLRVGGAIAIQRQRITLGENVITQRCRRDGSEKLNGAVVALSLAVVGPPSGGYEDAIEVGPPHPPTPWRQRHGRSQSPRGRLKGEDLSASGLQRVHGHASAQLTVVGAQQPPTKNGRADPPRLTAGKVPAQWRALAGCRGDDHGHEQKARLGRHRSTSLSQSPDAFRHACGQVKRESGGPQSCARGCQRESPVVYDGHAEGELRATAVRSRRLTAGSGDPQQLDALQALHGQLDDGDQRLLGGRAGAGVGVQHRHVRRD